MTPEKHPDEAARLATLRGLDILDTPPEKAFDDVVNLASQICGTPMSLISLVDGDRQWFKASVGLDASETTLEESICAHAILNGAYFEVPDTQAEAITADNPLVTGSPGLRFYAGAILRAANGLPLGSLCVLDHKPRKLTEFQRDALQVLARQVVGQIELRAALAEAELLRREVDHRVKNSLQSVSALTRLQARGAKSEETRQALNQVQRQIQTIAAMHELLHRADLGDSICLRDFLQSVCRLAGGSAPPGVRILCNAPDLCIGPTEAAALGVILNEFATNSFKYAFPDGRPGIIKADVTKIATGEAQLVLSDDGIGIEPGQDIRSGLGMQVMEASASQLGSEFRLDTAPPGLRLTLTFALNAP